jgi:hypothetical protein
MNLRRTLVVVGKAGYCFSAKGTQTDKQIQSGASTDSAFFVQLDHFRIARHPEMIAIDSP